MSRSLLTRSPFRFAFPHTTDGFFLYETEAAGVTDVLVSTSSAVYPIALYSVTKPDTISDPAFSPDGRHVVFCEKIGSTFKISRVTPGGGGHTVLQSGVGQFADPSYSSDGSFILFAVQTGVVSGPHPYGQWALKFMYADGSHLTTIVDDGNANVHPCWVTPTQIAFQFWSYGATPSSTFEVVLCDLAGQGRQTVGVGEYPRVVMV